jgi:hypothetical protein
MTPEDQAEVEINVAADPDNGPIYIATLRSDEWAENGSGWSRVVVLALMTAVICWLILRFG